MPQPLEELKERVKTIGTVFETVLGNWANLSIDTKQQLTTGINKAFGQAAGFEHEYQTTKAAENKGRPVITQIHGDVTTGDVDSLFAKSIEVKNLTAPKHCDANGLIKKAIFQLSGGTKHPPRANDVRVIDLRIDGSNPWPLAGGEYGKTREITLLDTIENTAWTVLWGFFEGKNAVPGSSNLLQWLNEETHSAKGLKGDAKISFANDIQKFQNTNPHSSRLLLEDKNGNAAHLRCFIIKIRYSSAYIVYKKENSNKTLWLDELTFRIFKNISSPKAKFDLAKVKYRVPDTDNPLRRFHAVPTPEASEDSDSS